MKSTVLEGYNENSYLEVFRTKPLTDFESNLFNKCYNKITENNNDNNQDVLLVDLGCGNGKPYDEFFINKGINVVGVDFCEKHINSAKSNFSDNQNASFYLGDFSYLLIDITKGDNNDDDCDDEPIVASNQELIDILSNQSVDIFCSFYAIFHLPRDTHKDIYRAIFKLLKPGGYFFTTLNMLDTEIDNSDSWCNGKMAWSGYDIETNKKMLQDIGYEINDIEIEGIEGENEYHAWAILQKPY
eukprot:TRINITY_DN5463_c0_g2_i1.p1 TRINITY_DN5463_c0_g2~~TRINITY_DN5463_c0_g2_i1.p1  ORF type:complete len:243 (-),score=83.69 TRINITY_DN5463_c0_g2_i1:167-895(-)